MSVVENTVYNISQQKCLQLFSECLQLNLIEYLTVIVTAKVFAQTAKRRSPSFSLVSGSQVGSDDCYVVVLQRSARYNDAIPYRAGTWKPRKSSKSDPPPNW